MMKPRSNSTIFSICGGNFHLFSCYPYPRPVTWYRFLSCTLWTLVLLTLAKPCANYVSMSMETLTRAWEVLQDAYQAQMEGDYDRAVELYQSSLEVHPTAEAHTFLGWTYHFQGRLEEAIAECKRAIELDPEFGNPYNDIGAYLIEMRRFDEAIPWLERAVEARRYDPRHYPYYNLGRAYLAKEMYSRARESFQTALSLEPRYTLAREALDRLRRIVN